MEQIQLFIDLLNRNFGNYAKFKFNPTNPYCNVTVMIFEELGGYKFSAWCSFEEFIQGSRLMKSVFDYNGTQSVFKQKIDLSENIIDNLKKTKTPEELYVKFNLLGLD